MHITDNGLRVVYLLTVCCETRLKAHYKFSGLECKVLVKGDLKSVQYFLTFQSTNDLKTLKTKASIKSTPLIDNRNYV